MKELGINMQVITNGISREDWALEEKNAAEKNAALLADPTQPTLTG